mmetsp:Transcript_8771/g.22469  ORF Transcript_8771/g.22469 Transcript_8771/m.22469 type:complete len:147 (-) Transcript_8771:91-531(-)
MAGPLAAMFNQIRSRRGKNSYRFKHPRPQAHVWPHQVPQVMLQMLVTGTERCKFVSFTPTNGIKVFDIRRDAQYIGAMLSIVSRVYERYLKRGQVPPENMFFREDEYQRFLQRTRQIAEESDGTFCENPAPALGQHDYAARLFWDE